MDRNGIILAGLKPLSSRVLEIGPSFAPIAAKQAGWRTTVVDHTDQAGLIAKYREYAEIDVSAIEEVDHIWAGGPLDAVIPNDEHGTYDALIASHVIEHLADPASFLVSADRLLKPEGRVLLAVPDLRLCFDCMRPTSTTGQILAAWHEGRVRHSWAAVFDAWAYDARPATREPSWHRSVSFEPQLIEDLRIVARRLEGYRERGDGEYVDVHAWTFTPASFSLIVLELQALGVSRWRLEQLIDCPAVEFLAFLGRSTEALPDNVLARERTRLMVKRWAELREQADWMLGAYLTGTAADAPLSVGVPPALAAEIARLREVTQALIRLGEALG